MSFTYFPGLSASRLDGNDKRFIIHTFDDNTPNTPIIGGRWLLLGVIPVIVLLGTLGNLMTMAVLLRPKFRKLNVNVYLFCMAIADTIFLWTNSLTVVSINYLLGSKYGASSVTACQAHMFIYYTSKCLSAWFAVAVTIERLLVVLFPLKMMKSTGRKRAIIMVLVLPVLASAVFAITPRMHTVSWVKEDREDRCIVKDSFEERNADVYLKTGDLVIYSLLPTIALVVSNTILIYRLISSLHFRRINTKTPSERPTNQDRGAQRLTITLILVSGCFLICTLPISALLVYFTLDPAHLQSLRTVYIYLYTLAVFNSSVNFLLYCVSGPTFRAEVWWGCRKVVCRRRDTSKPTGVSPEQSPESF